MTFTIDKNGEVTVNVQGAKGGECDQWTAPFEEILGFVQSKARKDSYFAEVDETQTQEQDT